MACILVWSAEVIPGFVSVFNEPGRSELLKKIVQPLLHFTKFHFESFQGFTETNVPVQIHGLSICIGSYLYVHNGKIGHTRYADTEDSAKQLYLIWQYFCGIVKTKMNFAKESINQTIFSC